MLEILEDTARKTRESLARTCEQETTQPPFTMHAEKIREKQMLYAKEVREWRQHENLRFNERQYSPRPRISSGLEAAIFPTHQRFQALLPQSDVQATSRPLALITLQSSGDQRLVTSQASTQPYIHPVPNQQIPLHERQQNLRRQSSGDPFEQEIQIMSSVVAYLELSVDRFIESIGMTIREFWTGLGKELQRNLVNRLNLTPERAARLVLDDSNTRAKRKELTRRKSALVEALNALRTLENSENVAET